MRPLARRLGAWIGRWVRRMRYLRRRTRAERDMDEEFRIHVELEAEQYLREGLEPQEARRRALVAFGGVERFKEEARAARGTRWLEDLAADLRYAVRTLRKRPGFTTAAVLTLALGVGANASVFALVNATLFRPLPFPDSERLVALYRSVEGAGLEPWQGSYWSYPEFAALRSSSTTVSPLVAYHVSNANLAGGAGEPVRVGMEMVSTSYFRMLGIGPTIGRDFLSEEDSGPGAPPVAVLGHGLWTRAFGAEAAVVGERIVLNGVALRVVGVMPEGFRGLTGGAEVWIPHAMAPDVYFPGHLTTSERFLGIVGRLRPGSSVEEARAEIGSLGTSAVAVARRRAGAESDGRSTVALASLDEARRDPEAVRAQLVLAGAVLFVLLIAVVDLSGLFLARSLGRSREMAVRTALGAGRRRIMRQVLVESGLVGLIGGAVGILLAIGSVRVLSVFAPEGLGGGGPGFARLDPFAAPAMDWRVVAFAGVLSLAAGLLVGLGPAFRSARGRLTDTFKAGARGSTVGGVGSLRRPTVLSGVAVAQVAFALVLLVGAGLLLQGFHRLRSLDPGVEAAGVLTFRLSPPEGEYARGSAAAGLHERVLERVEAVPGVASATLGRCVPFQGPCSTTYLHIAGRAGTDEPPLVGRHYVDPDHFSTLGIPLLRGRGITDEDRAGRARAAVINETAARRFWPGEDPIGQRVWFASGGGFGSPDSLTTIVGVVDDVHYPAPGEPIGPDIYTSFRQYTVPGTVVMVRAAGESPAALVPALRQAVADVDPNLAIYDVRTVRELADAALAGERFATVALGAFATLGLLLAALGIYGVMAYSVEQRRREVGIRLALGAAPQSVVRRVVGQGFALVAVGLAVGTVLALAFSRTLSALIADIGSVDPVVFGVVVAALLSVALISCYLPARVAARVDPVDALASE